MTVRLALTAIGFVVAIAAGEAQAQIVLAPSAAATGSPDQVGTIEAEKGSAGQSAPAPRGRVRRTLIFLAGGATGLGVHELGHVVTSAAFGANPRVKGIDGSLVPFFAIVHDPVPRRKEFVISSSGFWMQHLGSELILSRAQDLRERSAPFAKGVLAFNLGTSVVYGAAAFTRRGPAERDTRGMAVSLGDDGVPEPVVGVLVLAPAVLDGYRYLRPNEAWARWLSRSLKVLGVVLMI